MFLEGLQPFRLFWKSLVGKSARWFLAALRLQKLNSFQQLIFEEKVGGKEGKRENERKEEKKVNQLFINT